MDLLLRPCTSKILCSAADTAPCFACFAAFACIFALARGNSMAAGLAVTGGVVLIASMAIHTTCHQYNRPAYRVPFFPYAPAASLLLNCFLLASLPAQAFWQLGIFFAVVIVFYVLYSIHAGTAFERKHNRGVLATTTAGTMSSPRPDSMRVISSFQDHPNIIMPYRSPSSHMEQMQGRWSGGVTRLPSEF
jgi:uncharacterized membrane protein